MREHDLSLTSIAASLFSDIRFSSHQLLCIVQMKHSIASTTTNFKRDNGAPPMPSVKAFVVAGEAAVADLDQVVAVAVVDPTFVASTN